MAAYDKYGTENLICHWCGRAIIWEIGRQMSTGDGDIACVVDHLNDNGVDNVPDNLVVSCANCNRRRGYILLFTKDLLPERVEQFIELTRRAATAPDKASKISHRLRIKAAQRK